MTTVTDQAERSATAEVPRLNGIDYIELYVGNAQQAAHFYRTTYGFTPLAYAGPETGARDRVSFVIGQGAIRLVFTSAVAADHPITQHVALHGDGVRDIAFAVDDAALVFERLVRAGARPIAEPTTVDGPDGQLTTAMVGVFGDTVHTLVQRDTQARPFLPAYQPIKHPTPSRPIGLSAIDHIAICVEPGGLNHWTSFYAQALGFIQVHEENIVTEYSAMNSKAIEDPSGRIKFPMQEPAPGKRTSQIEEYLAAYHGPGAQHIAVLTDDIIAAVRALRENGIEFRTAPGTYFDMLEERVGTINADIGALRELHILVDRDKWGYLMQIFAKPTQSRPTLFCEVIQRAGARGFGSGNIKALFESIEREQRLRGTL